MKIGIAVFVYNRDWHLMQTLEGLKKNKEVNEIYVFQDGLKIEEHRKGWESVRQVIDSIDWCRVNYFLAEKNMGLAISIVNGINWVLRENDAIIVLEDDCVPTANFFNFMFQCLKKYRYNMEIYSVSGYAWPIDVKRGEFDIYFTRRVSTWGWGTWKDRWKQYVVDSDILNRIKSDQDKSRVLATWGKDLERMYVDRLAGRNDSWAIFWALMIIEKKGLCIAPYVSFIQNIGFDGSGIHCGKTNRFIVDLERDIKKEYRLPDTITKLNDIIEAFVSLYGSYTSINLDEAKSNVIVYGLGNFFMQNEKYINDKYFIVAFIDREKTGYFAGKKIIKSAEIKLYKYDKIIVMLQDVQECLKVRKMLNQEYSVPLRKICIGMDAYIENRII